MIIKGMQRYKTQQIKMLMREVF